MCKVSMTKYEIDGWMNGYQISGVEKYVINDDLTVDAEACKDESIIIRVNEKIPVKFRNVVGNFSLVRGGYNGNIMEGCPKTVTGYFSISHDRKIKNLIGSPEYVGGNFYANECENVETLQGCPRVIEGCFFAVGMKKLRSLEGCSAEVGRLNIYYCTNIVSLKGFPSKMLYERTLPPEILGQKISGGFKYTRFSRLFFNNEMVFEYMSLLNDEKMRCEFLVEAYKKEMIDEEVLIANVPEYMLVGLRGLLNGKKFGL